MRIMVIIIEVLVWLLSFFFIKHGKSVYEPLLLPTFVLSTVDIVIHLLGAERRREG